MKIINIIGVVIALMAVVPSIGLCDGNYVGADSKLWIKAVINTEELGPVDAAWKFGGIESTAAGDTVVWGFFYADPSDVAWGDEENPDLYVKIWFDRSGRIDVNFFHVSVPDITVYSSYDNSARQEDTTTMGNRYVRHEFSQ